jgi:mRNA-degrading endonuclease RelE of RelBE toxin-antitoxin system
MKVRIIPSPEFNRRFRWLAKKYRSLPADYLTLSKELKENPFQGDSLGGGVRKVRMAIRSKGKGKSGGSRVLTLTVLVSGIGDQTEANVTTVDADVTLLTIYDKEEIDNVSDNYIKWLVSEAKK